MDFTQGAKASRPDGAASPRSVSTPSFSSNKSPDFITPRLVTTSTHPEVLPLMDRRSQRSSRRRGHPCAPFAFSPICVHPQALTKTGGRPCVSVLDFNPRKRDVVFQRPHPELKGCVLYARFPVSIVDPANPQKDDDTPRSNSGGSDEQNLVTCHILAGGLRVDCSESRQDDADIPINSSTPMQPLLSTALRAVLLSEMVPVTAVKQLQLASSSICGDFRESTGFHVEVNSRTPRRLWTASRDARGQRRRGRGAGVAGVPAVLVSRLTLGDRFNPTVTNMRWPERLRQITFGKQFGNSLSCVQWPRMLTHVRFGCSFNQPFVGVKLPRGLLTLTLGEAFNPPLDRVEFPDGLQMIALCRFFDQPLCKVNLPGGLQQLAFGRELNQPISDVVWPQGPRNITFSQEFDQPLVSVAFPSSVQRLDLGDKFNQNLGGVMWPVDLEYLKFGCRFKKTLEHTRLPRRQATLKMCCHWDHPLALLVDLTESLKFLQLSDAFDQPLDEVRFPPGLAYLYLGDNFDQPLHDVQWPTNLKVLYLGDSFDHSLGIQEWAEGLESLFLGETSLGTLIPSSGRTA